MTKKRGVLRRIVSKAVAVGRGHVPKVMKGEETFAEAAGATVEAVLSNRRAKSTTKPAAKKIKPKAKTTVRQRPTMKKRSTRKKAKMK
jgi:hypothetical protein